MQVELSEIPLVVDTAFGVGARFKYQMDTRRN